MEGCHAARMRIVSLALAALALGSLAACSNGFQEADIQDVKKAIRAEFEKDARYSVVEVVMIKASATKLDGFIRLRSKLIGEFTKSCSATMAEGGRDFLWRCGN